VTSFVVLHGPSLRALGRREPHVYGTATLADVDRAIREEATTLGVDVRIEESAHEGALIDWLLALLDAPSTGGVVLNAGAYAHTSLAIADAIRAIHPIPVVEVHLTNTCARDPARHATPVGSACVARIEGFGPDGYVLALRGLVARARAR
jgi:3-dehydroquinate dehydratase-2